MDNFFITKRGFTARFYAILTIVSLILSAFPASFFIAHAQNAPEKIDICHATNSHNNPYNSQSPNESADVSGHDGHDGPVWFDGITESWGDIIPPFDYDGGSYPGKNWTAEGQAIYNNNCEVPAEINGTISGVKFHDLDDDGDPQEGEEPELSDWEIRLYEVDTPWVLVSTTTTDGDGEYEFNDITEGSYKVCELMKEGWTQTFVSNGSANMSPNVFEEGPECRTVNVDTPEDSSTVNFGNYFEKKVKAAELIVITGDTWDAVGDPTGTGWFFNPFLPFTAPFEFNDEKASIGDGAFFGGPISSISDSKIIATLQKVTPIADLWSFSYDFQIESNDVDDENEFYLNVYTNFGSSDPNKFYDCRYDVVPTTGSLSSFTTVTFDPAMAYPVTQSGTSPETCPAIPADMESIDDGSVIRAFALNIGDTAAQDEGVSGYFDNVVLMTETKITTYDMEPLPEPEEPQICSYEGDVIEYSDPAFTNGGGAVNPDRRNVAAVESGVAPYTNFFGKEENDWQVDPLDFFSLGIEGYLVYEFTDKVVIDQLGDDIAIWEITGGPADEQANEKAAISVSQNGSDFFPVGTVTGDGSVDIASAGLDFVKYVKVTDMSVGVQGNNGDGYDLDAITIIEGSCDDYLNLHTSKIVCEDEEDLPNWGGGGSDITASTAIDWVNEEGHESCELVDGWQFEWAPNGNSNPGDTFIGPAGGEWSTFTGSIMIPMSEFGEDDRFWMREVLSANYIPFTFGPEGKKNTDDVTAEMYCHTDVKNYDNFDRVDDPEAGEDFYCVGWNVLDEEVEPEPLPVCDEYFTEGYVFTQEQILLSHDAGGAFIGPEDIELPAGHYDVNALSFEDHVLKWWDMQEEEQWFVNGYFEISKVFTSEITIDIPNGINTQFSELDRGVYLPDGLDALEWVHAAYPEDDQDNLEYNSVYPVCIQFLPVEEPYGPYCGDGEMNQEWEVCDGDDVPEGEECTDYCTLANQCTTEKLVKISFDPQAPESVSFNNKIYLGTSSSPIPSGVWFNFDEVGDDTAQSIANAAEGLAVQRTADELILAVKGDNGGNEFDYVFGNIMTKGIDLGVVDRSPIPGWALENSGNYIDVFDKDMDEGVDFKFWLTTGDDAASVKVDQGETYDCPECKAEVEARIVLQDGEEITTNGDGNLLPQVILGDGSTVAFGEWFKISEAPVSSSSAVWIDDPETVTNFTNPADLEGLFVSREGNGMVKIALYGFHSPGGDTNYESLRATIEFNDAKVLSGSTMDLLGDYKIENHSEGDNVNSNDNFDSFVEAGDLESIDFDLWVDTKADGIKITLDPESCLACDDDTDPEDPTNDPEKHRIDGYKYEVNGSSTIPGIGWTIYATNGSTTLSTTTDSNGYYYFEVMEGHWEITEEDRSGWTLVDVHMYESHPYELVKLLDEQQGTTTSCTFWIEDYEDDLILQYQGDYEYGYSCDFYNEQDDDDDNGGGNDGGGDTSTSSNPNPSSSNGGGGGGGGTRVTQQSTSTPQPLVAGAATSQCGMYLFDYMRMGQENSPYEVTKLQFFLNGQGFFIPVTGIFDTATDQAVRSFQALHQADVLTPWFRAGYVPHENPTGWVYQLTRWKINNIVCPGSEQLPNLLP